MSTFVVTFIGLIATLLIVTPYVWRLTRDNEALHTCLQDAQKTIAETIQQTEYYRMACEHAPDGIVVQDMAGRILWSNPAFSRIHGRSEDEVRGKHPLEFARSPEQTPDATEIAKFRYDQQDERLNNLVLVENQRANGEMFWNQLSVSFRRAADGRETAIQVCRDVTEQVEQANELREISHRLEHEATHDGLTGVQNRAAFLAFCKDALVKTETTPVGLLHIDLDNFKSVNDTHGHSAGDAVLKQTTKVLRDCTRLSDMVARVGGDEFVVVCPAAPDLAFMDELSRDLIEALSEPFEWSNHILQCDASIGAAVAECCEISADDLLMRADFALYEAKRAGRNRAILYDENLHARQTAYIVRSKELAETVKTGALNYVFQPTLNLETGEICGIETLVRWQHPRDGMIPPDDFLPMVKDLGLMGALDLCSMTAALTEKRRLNLAGFPDLGVAFNASPELLAHPEFINRLVWGVEAGGIDRSHITIEVLETTDFGDAHETSSHAAIISDLRHAGFQVHLDDFGIGFAGLSHLATLDVTGVKIDRGLIRDILTNATNEKIVRKTIELSNDLDLTVIAEGVEDLATANALHAMGCGVIQGYWLAKPLPPDQVPDWLAAQANRPNPLCA